MEISIRAYARLRGVDHVKILRDIKAGLIPKTASGKIDPEAADAAWERNRAPQQASKRTAHPEATAPGSQDPPKAKDDQAKVKDESDEDARSYAKAREMREYVKLESDEIDLGKLKGRLISTDDVQLQARTTAHLVREGMLAIPDRVCSLLAAEMDSAKVHTILSVEIRKALMALADGN